MPTTPPSPPLVLPSKVRKAVERWSRSAKLPHRIVERAKIVTLACGGCSNAGIARLLGVTEQTVRKWRERMRRLGDVKSLNDLPNGSSASSAGSGPGRRISDGRLDRLGCQFATSWGHPAEIFAGSWGHPVAA